MEGEVGGISPWLICHPASVYLAPAMYKARSLQYGWENTYAQGKGTSNTEQYVVSTTGEVTDSRCYRRAGAGGGARSLYRQTGFSGGAGQEWEERRSKDGRVRRG